MPTHYLYLPKAYFSVGSSATVHRVFADEDNTFSMTCLDAGGDKVYGTFSAGYNGNGGGAFTLEVLVGGTYRAAVYNGSNVWEWTPPTDGTGWLGDCAGCSCAPTDCDRRATAIKRWNGWFRWDGDPTTSFLTTRYRKLTVTIEYSITGEAFAYGDFLYVNSSYTPAPGDVQIGTVFPCDGTPVGIPYYNTSGGAPANYTFWPGGSFTRVAVSEIARHEQQMWAGTGLHDWRLPVPLPAGHPGVPAVGPNTVSITETDFADPVYTYTDPHPAQCSGCAAPTETTEPTWATQATPVPGYDVGPCNNYVKFLLDNLIGCDTLDSESISGDGLTYTRVYSGVYPGGALPDSTVSATVTAVLSEPYTLGDAMTDADALVLDLPLDGSILFLKACSGENAVLGCAGWPTVPYDRNNDMVAQEDWVCSASQEFDVDYMENVLALADDIVAQRMVYDTGTSAYVVVTRSTWLPHGNSLRTVPYTKSNNLTETAGTPSDSALTDDVRTYSAPASYPSLEIQYRI